MRLTNRHLLNAWVAAATLVSVASVNEAIAGASTGASTRFSVAKLKPQYAKMDKTPVKKPARIARLEGSAIHHQELEIPMCGYWPSKEQLKYRALEAASAVDPTVPIKAKVTTLSDGTKLDSLKDEALFDENLKRLVPGTATADLTNGYVKETVLKAFAQMDCLEYADLGANTYTAPDIFKPLNFGGKNVVAGATAEKNGPVLNLTIGGRIYYINMTLPGLVSTSHNVVVVSNGQKVLAIDPRTDDTWQLHMRLPYHQYFSWSKLTHTRGKVSAPKSGV